MTNNFIHENARIGENVQVGSSVFIDDNVEIGDNTIIYPNATILAGTRIGNNCKIYPGAVLGGDPQDISYKGEETSAIIGNNTILREFVTVNRGTKSSGKTTVGDNCYLMAYVHIAHDCVVGNNCIFANVVNLGGHVHVGDYVVMGGMVGVHQFVHIGSHAMIAAGMLLRKDVPPFVKAARESNAFAGVNTVGLRRRGFSSDDIAEIKEIYRILFVEHNNITNAVSDIEKKVIGSPNKTQILEFIRSSSRGLIRGIRS
jgi:UDP-N-acetylglucosamine acyltransferase